MNEVSVVIVSWNACAHLRACLASVRAERGTLVREILVVDNASDDGSPAMVAAEFPEVTLLRATENLGFARANNLAIPRARGALLALINSDVVVRPGCLQTLAAQLDAQPGTGLVGPRIVGPDGRVQGSCRRLPTVWNTLCRALALDVAFPRQRWCAGHEMRHFAHDTATEAEVLSGCFWMARASAAATVGPLDERFFFYMEDVDWCRRFRQLGWRLRFVPEATAVHGGGGSSRNAPLRFAVQYLRANLAYWRKVHGPRGALAYRALALTHHGLRLAARLALWPLRAGAGQPRRQQARDKLREDAVCLRFLLTGRDATPRGGPAQPRPPRPPDGRGSAPASAPGEPAPRRPPARRSMPWARGADPRCNGRAAPADGGTEPVPRRLDHRPLH